mmetsp:Transcript_4922/g.11804  ORF Transcript_4922/g.11804 Transcript_4922/m.11804 type:complete len:315 (-) Transcript_4922:9876-10820(-)
METDALESEPVVPGNLLATIRLPPLGHRRLSRHVPEVVRHDLVLAPSPASRHVVSREFQPVVGQALKHAELYREQIHGQLSDVSSVSLNVLQPQLRLGGEFGQRVQESRESFHALMNIAGLLGLLINEGSRNEHTKLDRFLVLAAELLHFLSLCFRLDALIRAVSDLARVLKSGKIFLLERDFLFVEHDAHMVPLSVADIREPEAGSRGPAREVEMEFRTVHVESYHLVALLVDSGHQHTGRTLADVHIFVGFQHHGHRQSRWLLDYLLHLRLESVEGAGLLLKRFRSCWVIRTTDPPLHFLLIQRDDRHAHGV